MENEVKKNNAKGCLGCFGILVVLMIVIIAFMSSGSDEEVTKEDVLVNINTTELSVEEKIKKVITHTLGDTTNMDKKRIELLQINNNAGTTTEGDKIVFIKLNANENLTNNLTKSGILMDTAELLSNLYKINEISVTRIMWQLPLTDTYGNTSDDKVMTIAIDRDIANKINWDNFDYNNFQAISSEYFEHPAFNK